MLKYWKRFWKARRQRDSVKVLLLLVATTIGFLVSTAYRSMSLYRMINQPTEYVLSGGNASDIADMPYLVAVSPQLEIQRTLVYQGRELPISCITLSKEYLRKAYGIELRGATETFYANQSALHQMEVTEKEFFATCRSEEGEKREFQTTVKIVLAEGIHDQNHPLIFVVDSQQGMAGVQQMTAMNGMDRMDRIDGMDATQGAVSGTAGGQSADSRIRVCFQRQDLEGSQRKQLEQRGFTVENREQLLEVDWQKDELLLRIKYEALIGLFLAICTFTYLSITLNIVYIKRKEGHLR